MVAYRKVTAAQLETSGWLSEAGGGRQPPCIRGLQELILWRGTLWRNGLVWELKRGTWSLA